MRLTEPLLSFVISVDEWLRWSLHLPSELLEAAEQLSELEAISSSIVLDLLVPEYFGLFFLN